MRIFNIKLLFLLISIFSVSFCHLVGAQKEETKDSTGEESAQEDYSGVSLEISKETQELIGLKTKKVESSTTAEKIIVTGRISQNVENTIEVFSPEEGIVKECPSPIGTTVSKGQVLCIIESSSSKETIEIKAPSSGVVVADFDNVGQTIDPISPIHIIADLSKLHANFDVYENDIGKIKTSQSVLVYSTAYPDETFLGKTVFVSPQVDETSFTIKIRVQIDNSVLLLKPGMFVRGEIALEDNQAHLSVPTEAVQNIAGMMMVFLQDEPESFTATKVKVRSANRNQTLVEGDINEGDLVVADGAYIIKSKILESEITGGCTDGH